MSPQSKYWGTCPPPVPYGSTPLMVMCVTVLDNIDLYIVVALDGL